jgi:hypothetical protein
MDVQAYLNHGYWKADCPKCGKLGAVLAQEAPLVSPHWAKDGEYICPNCYPGIVATFTELHGKRIAHVPDILAREQARKRAEKAGDIHHVVFPKNKARIDAITTGWVSQFANWTPGMSLQALAETAQHNSYTTPITFVALQTLTAAQMNGVQANISEMGSVFSATGNVPYAASTTTLGVTAKPATALPQVFKNTSTGVPSYSLPFLFGTRVYASANQSVVNDAVVLWDSEFHDDEGLHSTSVNTSRFTIATTGRYNIHAYLTGTGTSSTNLWIATILRNGTETLGVDTYVFGSSLDFLLNPIALGVDLTAADFVTVILHSQSGTSPNTVFGGITKSKFAIQRSGPQ